MNNHQRQILADHIDRVKQETSTVQTIIGELKERLENLERRNQALLQLNDELGTQLKELISEKED